jgi:hypothetical protein
MIHFNGVIRRLGYSRLDIYTPGVTPQDAAPVVAEYEHVFGVYDDPVEVNLPVPS